MGNISIVGCNPQIWAETFRFIRQKVASQTKKGNNVSTLFGGFYFFVIFEIE